MCENIVRERERRSGLWLDSGFAENLTLCRSIKCFRLVVESSILFLVSEHGSVFVTLVEPVDA